jgi:hypothetical protein
MELLKKNQIPKLIPYFNPEDGTLRGSQLLFFKPNVAKGEEVDIVLTLRNSNEK